MSDIVNLPEKLAREIARVSQLRGIYEALDGMHGANCKPVLMMMDASLEQAKKAAGLMDPEAQIAAVLDLEGFSE